MQKLGTGFQVTSMEQNKSSKNGHCTAALFTARAERKQKAAIFI